MRHYPGRKMRARNLEILAHGLRELARFVRGKRWRLSAELTLGDASELVRETLDGFVIGSFEHDAKDELGA